MAPFRRKGRRRRSTTIRPFPTTRRLRQSTMSRPPGEHRRRRSRPSRRRPAQKPRRQVVLVILPDYSALTGSSRSHSSKDRLMSSRPRTNTQRKCLLSFLKVCHTSQLAVVTHVLQRTFEIGPRGLLTEYTEQIRSYVPPTATFNAFTANANKNRYHGTR